MTDDSYAGDDHRRARGSWGGGVRVGDLEVGNDEPLVVIAGPCAIESRSHALDVAGSLAGIARRAGVGLVYKSSFDKANRTSFGGGRGVGLDEGLEILAAVRTEVGVPTLTDVHEAGQCAAAARSVDILQIPAFLCRQTDLLVAAAATGACVNVKKGQFLAPGDMVHGVDKVRRGGADRVMVTERGVSFGYHALVNDFRALPIMAETCRVPVVFDATHSVQEPGGLGGRTGGSRRFAPMLARCAVSMGIAAVFMEVHPDPDKAPSDGPNMVPLAHAERIFGELKELDAWAKGKLLPG